MILILKYKEVTSIIDEINVAMLRNINLSGISSSASAHSLRKNITFKYCFHNF